MGLRIAPLLGIAGVVACGAGTSKLSSTPLTEAGEAVLADGGTEASRGSRHEDAGGVGTHPGASADSGVETGARVGNGDAARGDATARDAEGVAVDGGAKRCKRGLAATVAPTSAFAPTSSSSGISWWYDWSPKSTGGSAAIEFVPMVWGSADLNDPLPVGSRDVLGFNEPNFKAQSDLSPEEAATDWPMLEMRAKAAGIPIVAPGVNFCGSSTDSTQCTVPTVTDPYTYLKDFLAACPGCEVDYVAAHWYNCDLPSLRAYLEGNLDAGGGLEGFVQFGKPIWLTEFACDGSHSVADQKAYMQVAIPYLESNPHVFRYSWFSADAIPTAVLANADGSLTDLGTTYVGLAENCP